MKHLLPLVFILTCCVTSCMQENCVITDYHAIQWDRLDSTTSFFICSNNATKLAANDTVEIEYLGILQKEENLVVQNETDKLVLSMLAAAKFGQVSLSDTTLPANFRAVLGQMTTASVATVKINLAGIQPIEQEKKLTVYFNPSINTAAAIKWINEFKTKPFVQSTHYISQEEAIKNWTKDQADSSWISVLKDNPLPSSVEIIIHPGYFDTAFIKNLKNELLQSAAVADVMYPNTLGENNLKDIQHLLSNEYLVRIKPVK